MPTIQNLKIERAGEVYRGSYKVEACALVVLSPYGIRSAPVGKKPTIALAEELLHEIVEAFIARARETDLPRKTPTD